MTTIDRYAFYDSNIKGAVYFTGTEEQWKAITPSSAYGLKTPIFDYNYDE